MTGLRKALPLCSSWVSKEIFPKKAFPRPGIQHSRCIPGSSPQSGNSACCADQALPKYFLIYKVLAYLHQPSSLLVHCPAPLSAAGKKDASCCLVDSRLDQLARCTANFHCCFEAEEYFEKNRAFSLVSKSHLSKGEKVLAWKNSNAMKVSFPECLGYLLD